MASVNTPILNCCEFLDCNENKGTHHLSKELTKFCDYHEQGGLFGSGDAYDQYQIIESDFIDFIRTVPLCQEHLGVHSLVLRDIIIRTCVQIEMFFKEWAKEVCTSNPTSVFWSSYNKNGKGAKNWGIKDYFQFKDQLDRSSTPHIYVVPTNEILMPFAEWEEFRAMDWWSVYNNVKHGGHAANKQATLEIALFALAALFQLICTHSISRQYLKQFSAIGFKEDVSGHSIRITVHDITTPIDSKKFLFKALKTGEKKSEVFTVKGMRNLGKPRF